MGSWLLPTNVLSRYRKGNGIGALSWVAITEPLHDTDGLVIDYRPVPYPAKRMKPDMEKARENRVNPQGIAYLYLASDEDVHF